MDTIKYYYYRLNDELFGPFTFEELRSKRLKRSTLLWTEGMPEWTKGYEIEELREILIAEPPPFPTVVPTPPLVGINNIPQLESEGSNNKYDYTYTKETEITIIGVLLFVLPLIIKYSGVFTFESEESYHQGRIYLAFLSFVVRIGVTVWVVDIANRQNRNATGWGWFAFLLPSISLIFIGQLKKLRRNPAIYDSLPLEQQDKVFHHDLNFDYSESISSTKFSLEFGTYDQIEISFSNDICGNIMRGHSTGRYFYFHSLFGKTYAEGKADCIYQLYQYLNRRI